MFQVLFVFAAFFLKVFAECLHIDTSTRLLCGISARGIDPLAVSIEGSIE